jgi:hypothetical protein
MPAIVIAAFLKSSKPMSCCPLEGSDSRSVQAAGPSSVQAIVGAHETSSLRDNSMTALQPRSLEGGLNSNFSSLMSTGPDVLHRE